MTRFERWYDSYWHYRERVALNPVHALFRAAYHELTGRDWITRKRRKHEHR